MKWSLAILSLLLASGLVVLLPGGADSQPVEPMRSEAARFEANFGQAPDEVKFIERANGRSMFILDDGFVITQAKDDMLSHARVTFVGAQTQDVIGVHPHDSRVAVWKGNDWQSGLEYQEVQFQQVYPGIDVTFYANADGSIEFDFLVAPGADPARIQMHVPHAQLVAGELVLPGDVHLNAPYAYQKSEVPSHYVLQGDIATIALAGYDESSPLVIDPVVDQISFWGGLQSDTITKMLLDSEGNVWMAGTTSSLDFPITPDAFETIKEDLDVDIFITKMMPNRYILFSGYIGGDDEDIPNDMALDSQGNVYLTGTTRSDDFPTRNSYQTERASQNSNMDAFYMRIFADLSAPDISTYLGGGQAKAGVTHHDIGVSVLPDDTGGAYIFGHTVSADFPTIAGGHQTDAGRSEDLFVSYFHDNGNLIRSSYVFGDLQNPPGSGKELAVQLMFRDQQLFGLAYGDIRDLPTTPDAVQSQYNGGGELGREGILFAMDLDLGSVNYVSYFGGSGDDLPSKMILDGNDMLIAGSTQSMDLFTHPQAYFSEPVSTGWNAFILRLQPGETDYKEGTFFGGSHRPAFMPVPNARPNNFDHPMIAPFGNADAAPADNRAYDIALDPDRNIALVGKTDAYALWNNIGWHERTLPILRPLDDANLRFQGDADGFIAVLNPDMSKLHMSTYLGGTVAGEGNGVHGLDAMHHILITPEFEYFVTGMTDSEISLPFSDNPLNRDEAPLRLGMPERLGYDLSQYFLNPYTWIGAGAPGNDIEGQDAGAVYIYDINNPTDQGATFIWRSHEIITLPELDAEDHFGFNLAITGNGPLDVIPPPQAPPGATHGRAIMVVGAPGDDDVAQDAGAAYHFFNEGDSTTDTWMLDDPNAYPNGDGPPYQKFTAFDGQAGDRYGSKVVARDDGTIIIAAPYHDVTVGGTVYEDAGAIYIYQFDATSRQYLFFEKLVSPAPTAGGHYGHAMSMAQTSQRLAVGEPGSDIAVTNGGAVHIYQRAGLTTPMSWRQTVTDPNGLTGDAFGHSLRYHSAAYDTGTERLAVGAPHDDRFGLSSGAVFVFDVDDAVVFQLTQEIHQTYPAEGDLFGWYLDFDGMTAELLIGTPGDDDDGKDSGAVFFYDLSATTGQWDQRNKLKAPFPEAGDAFGHSLNFWDYAVISMPGADRAGTNRGAVVLNQNLHTPPINPVDRAPNWGIPGSPAWFVEAKFLADEHIPFADPDDTVAHSYGAAAAIDQDVAAVGAPEQDSTLNSNGDPIPTGATYVIRRHGSLWGQETTLYASDAGNGDDFGSAVDVDDGRIMVGAPFNADAGTGSGSAYIFTYNEALRQWEETIKLTASNAAVGDNFGTSVAISGNRAVVGAPGQIATDAGQVYVFELINGVWTEIANIVPDDAAQGLQFGKSVAIWDDSVFVGAPGDIVDMAAQAGGPGGVYIYEYDGADWLQTRNDIEPGNFGWSVDVWDDKAIVGAPLASSVTFYLETAIGWNIDASVVVGAPDNAIGQPGDRGGWDVAIHETTALAGLPLEETSLVNANDCTDCGSVVVLANKQGTWTIVIPVDTLEAGDPSLADAEHYGWAVGLSDNHAIVGAPTRAIDVGPNAGAAYLATAVGFWTTEQPPMIEDPNARRGATDIYFARFHFRPPTADFEWQQDNVAIEPGAPVQFPCANSPIRFADTSYSSGVIMLGGQPFEWVWDFGDATGSTVQNPIHTYAAPGTYTVSLDVLFLDDIATNVDRALVSHAVTVLANTPATIDLTAPATALEGTTVNIQAGLADPELRPLTVSWQQTAGPAVLFEDNIDPLNPWFVAPEVDAAGATVTFLITVFDGCATSTDTISVDIEHINKPPVADAGSDLVSLGGATLFLDGTGSSDPDGDTLQYHWVQTAGPGVDLFDSRTPTPSFVVPISPASNVITLGFELTVTDPSSEMDSDGVGVTVTHTDKAGAPPATGTGGGVAAGSGGGQSSGGSAYYQQTCTLYPSLCVTEVNCTEQPTHADCQEEPETEEGGVVDEGESEVDPESLNKVVSRKPAPAPEGPSVPWLVFGMVAAFFVLAAVGFVVIRQRLR